MNHLWIFSEHGGMMLAGALVTLVAGAAVVRRRAVTSSPWFGAFLLATSLWSLGTALEDFAVPEDLKTGMAKLEFLGVTLAFVFLVKAALEYMRLDGWFRRHRAALVLPWIAPAAAYLLILTNGRHHLFWSSIAPLPGSDGRILVYAHGPAFMGWIAYTYLILAAAAALLVASAVRRRDVYRRQALILLASMPWGLAANAAYVFGLTGRDMTPLGFALMGLLILWGLYRLRLFQLIPVAHERVVAGMDMAVVVVDPMDRILSMNPAAHALLEMAESPEARHAIPKAIGRDAAEIFAAWPALARELREPDERTVELSWSLGEPAREFEARVTPIMKEGREGDGVRLVVVHEISRLKRAEGMAQRERALAEVLRETGAALSSTLDRGKLPALVLGQILQIVRFDYAAFFMVEDGHLVLAGTSGFPDSPRFQPRRVPLQGCRYCAEVAAFGRPVLERDIRDTVSFPVDFPRGPIRSYLGLPVTTSEGVRAVIGIYSLEPTHFGDEDLRLTGVFASQVGVALENSLLYERMAEVAKTDGLTGLSNRTYFFERAPKDYAREARFRRAVSVMLIDIDHFKRINDTFGHLEGDRSLRAVADTLRKTTRTYDLLARYGGEEFIFFMPETDLATAKVIAERLRSEIQGLALDTPKGRLTVTASIGVAALVPGASDSLEALIKSADDNMYRAKAEGRNRVFA